MDKVKALKLTPTRLAVDLAGLTEILDELICNAPQSEEATMAVASAARRYAEDLASFFLGQPLVFERQLELMEAEWVKRTFNP